MKVALLETSVYSKAAQIFGHLPPPKKGLRGLNRKAKHSIELVSRKNNLISQINACDDPVSKSALQGLLDVV